nr:MAG TPA: dUTPase [Caudoviricetes sp.]
MIRFEIDMEKYNEYLRRGLLCREVAENPEVLIPRRSTSGSAGYDMVYPYHDIMLQADGTHYVIDSLVKVIMPNDIVGNIYARSGLSIKRGVVLASGVNVIDSDYRDTIKIALVIPDNRECTLNIPEGRDSIEMDGTYYLAGGTKICQMVFTKFYTTVDDDANQDRIGGLGSTGAFVGGVIYNG